MGVVVGGYGLLLILTTVVTLVALGATPLAQNSTVHALNPLLGFAVGLAIPAGTLAGLGLIARRTRRKRPSPADHTGAPAVIGSTVIESAG